MNIDKMDFTKHRQTPAEFREFIRRLTVCPICGLTKAHHRLYGYRCSNPEHYEQEQAMSEAEIAEALRKLEELK